MELLESLELPAKTALQTIRAASFCASTDFDREGICGVEVEVEDGSCTVVATDSFRLGWRTIARTGTDTGRIFVPSELVLDLRHDSWSRMAAKNETMVIRATKTDGTEIEIGRQRGWTQDYIDAPFPNWRQLVPDNPQMSTIDRLAFNPEYLNTLADIRRCLPPGSEIRHVEVTLSDALRPALFTLPTDDPKAPFHYLLMPIRLS